MFKINFFLISIFLIIFLLSSCGGSGSSLSVVTPESEEYIEWKKTLPATIEEFVSNSTVIMKDFKCVWFDNLGPAGSLSLPYDSYKNLSPSEIFRLKVLNCHFATILLQDVYGGEYLSLPNRPYSHAILFFKNSKGIWCYVSHSGKFTFKELSIDREEAYSIIRKDFHCTEIKIGFNEKSF